MDDENQKYFRFKGMKYGEESVWYWLEREWHYAKNILRYDVFVQFIVMFLNFSEIDKSAKIYNKPPRHLTYPIQRCFQNNIKQMLTLNIFKKRNMKLYDTKSIKVITVKVIEQILKLYSEFQQSFSYFSNSLRKKPDFINITTQFLCLWMRSFGHFYVFFELFFFSADQIISLFIMILIWFLHISTQAMDQAATSFAYCIFKWKPSKIRRETLK